MKIDIAVKTVTSGEGYIIELLDISILTNHYYKHKSYAYFPSEKKNIEQNFNLRKGHKLSETISKF